MNIVLSIIAFTLAGLKLLYICVLAFGKYEFPIGHGLKYVFQVRFDFSGLFPCNILHENQVVYFALDIGALLRVKANVLCR